MKLSNLSAGDTVLVNVRGRQFEAPIKELTERGTVLLDPPAGVNYYEVTARQVVRKIRSDRWNPDRTQVRRSK